MDLFNLVARITLDTSEYEKNLDNSSNKLDEAKSKFSSGVKSIGAGAGMFAALGAAAYKAADKVATNQDEIDKMSQKLGLSAKAYQEWDYVLKISGTEMSNMSTGLKTLTNKFDDAKNGSDKAKETFKKLGLSMRDIHGLSREELFEQVIYAFQDMEDSAERAALANDLFGRSGQELAPLFNTTSEETKGLIEQVNELGGVMSDDAVKQGAAFKDSITAVETALGGASAKLLDGLIPAITGFADKVTNFVSNGGLDKIVNLLKDLAPLIVAVVAGIAGFKIVTGIISVIQGFSTVFEILNAVMAANPIGLIITAIGLLVAAFVYLWNNCDAFREFWINLWEKIKSTFHNAVDKIKEKFEDFKEKLHDVKNKIIDGFDNMREKITSIFDRMKEAIKKPINAIIGFINSLINGVTNGINTVIRALNSLNFKIPDWVPSYGGKSIGFNLEELTFENIPLLAKGGIVRRPVIAGEAGAEAIVPLERNTEWIQKVANQINESNGGEESVRLMQQMLEELRATRQDMYTIILSALRTNSEGFSVSERDMARLVKRYAFT